MYVDFAVRYPQLLVSEIPSLARAIVAYDLELRDLSDLFARRRYGILRETFASTVGCMVARDLTTEATTARVLAFQQTELGSNSARALGTPYARAIRALSEVLIDAWKARSLKHIAIVLNDAVPNQAVHLNQLTQPFSQWLVESQHELSEIE